jgi:hypothetical protein
MYGCSEFVVGMSCPSLLILPMKKIIKAVYYNFSYNLSLFHCTVYSHDFSIYSTPISCSARFICHSFCLIPLNHKTCQLLINPSHFLNRCMLISNWNESFHKCVKFSVWLFLITHHRPANILYIFNIRFTEKPLI